MNSHIATDGASAAPTRRRLLTAAVFALFAFVIVGHGPAHAGKAAIFQRGGVALGGTDVVAYFRQGKPVAGSAAHKARFRGATFHFSSAAHRALFQANPAKYAPQFGGYCAWAVANGYTAPTVPAAWAIVGGKLYLNYSKGVRAQWSKDRAGNIRRGKANWPKVLKK